MPKQDWQSASSLQGWHFPTSRRGAPIPPPLPAPALQHHPGCCCYCLLLPPSTTISPSSLSLPFYCPNISLAHSHTQQDDYRSISRQDHQACLPLRSLCTVLPAWEGSTSTSAPNRLPSTALADLRVHALCLCTTTSVDKHR